MSNGGFHSSIEPGSPVVRAIMILQEHGHPAEARAVQRLLLERALYREDAEGARQQFDALLSRLRTPR